MNLFRLVIPGQPVGKARPRVTQNGTYTPAKTRRYERDVRAIWREAGCPRLPDDAALVAHIHVQMKRPANHFKRNGALSAEGSRNPFPCRLPDLDNVAKGLLDALNGLAYKDDRQIVELHMRRAWCRSGDVAHTVLTVHTKVVSGIGMLPIPEQLVADVLGVAA